MAKMGGWGTGAENKQLYYQSEKDKRAWKDSLDLSHYWVLGYLL